MDRRSFLSALCMLAPAACAAVTQKSPAWRAGMPLNKFSPIAGTAPSAFNLEPAWNKSRDRLCWVPGVIEHWNGLQTDEIRGVVYSGAAGGHASTEQNGVYRIGLTDDRPVWSVVRESTAFGPMDPANQNIAYFSDGRPTSRHTYYDGQVVEIDGKPVIVFAENLAATYVATSTPIRTDAFHIDRRDWDLRGGDWQPYPGVPRHSNCVAKDPRTQQIWVADVGSQINYLDPKTRRWTNVTRNMNSWGMTYVGSLIDPKRNRFVLAGSRSYRPSETPAFGVWHMSPGRYEDRPLSGDGLKSFWPGDHSGFVYDPIHDRYLVLMSGSGAVLSVDPDSFACSLLTKGPRAENGCLNRFAFVPILRGCFYLPRWKSEILFLPLA